MNIQLTLFIMSLMLLSTVAFGNVTSFGSDKEFSGRVIYEDEKTGTQVLELKRVPSELFSWTFLNRLDGILSDRNQNGSFGNFKSAHNSSFEQNFPQALDRQQGLLFNTVHPLNFRGGPVEFYGDILMKIHLKKDRAIQAIRIDKNWKTQQEAYGALITGNFDFRNVDLVYNSSLDEWIILNPSIVEGITADPDVLRPELEEWIKRLQEPDFKPPKGYSLPDGLFSFSSPDSLQRRVDTVFQIAKLLEEKSQKVKVVLLKHQVTGASPTKHDGSSSLIPALSERLRKARNKTELLAFLVPSWSDLVSNPEMAIARIQRENSDYTLVKIALNLDQEPLSEKIWNALAEKILSKTGDAGIYVLYRRILGMDNYMLGAKFALRLLKNYPDKLERNPELLSILLETQGYGIFEHLYQFNNQLEELIKTRGEPWTSMKSVIAAAQKNKSSDQEAAQNFRERIGIKAPSRFCKDMFSGGN